MTCTGTRVDHQAHARGPHTFLTSVDLHLGGGVLGVASATVGVAAGTMVSPAACSLSHAMGPSMHERAGPGYGYDTSRSTIGICVLPGGSEPSFEYRVVLVHYIVA